MSIDPKTHDEAIAAKYHELETAKQRAASARGVFFSVLNARRGYIGKRQVYVKPGVRNPTYAYHGDEATMEWAQDTYAAMDLPERSKRNLSWGKSPLEAMAALEAKQFEVDMVLAEIDCAERAYTGWSRFFLVTSSNGHVHSSMNCSTCRWTTTYGWLPQLSGKAEDEAVAELGPNLCSKCFASAPVEHQGGKITKAAAAKLAA